MSRKTIAIIITSTLVVFAVFNLTKAFSVFFKKDNTSSEIKDSSENKIENLEENQQVSLEEYFDINTKTEKPIEDGKLLSDIYDIDIVNLNILQEKFGWSDEAFSQIHEPIANSILMKDKTTVYYEIIPESISERRPEENVALSFECRDYYTKERKFVIKMHSLMNTATAIPITN